MTERWSQRHLTVEIPEPLLECFSSRQNQWKKSSLQTSNSVFKQGHGGHNPVLLALLMR